MQPVHLSYERQKRNDGTDRTADVRRIEQDIRLLELRLAGSVDAQAGLHRYQCCAQAGPPPEKSEEVGAVAFQADAIVRGRPSYPETERSAPRAPMNTSGRTRTPRSTS